MFAHGRLSFGYTGGAAVTETVAPPRLALAELAQLDQWVISKLVDGQKPPFSPHTRHMCSHSNPADWSSYQAARAALPGFTWLGFVFHDSDPYSGIDLDGCRDKETGAIAPWAQRIIAMCDSYTEVSPSGSGVKLWVRGTLPEQIGSSMGPHKGIEVYSTKRHFTFTGQQLPGTPPDIRDAQYALDVLWSEYHKEPAPAAPRKAYNVSKGEAANGRQNADDVIPRLNRANDAGDYLAHQGATLIHTRGESRYYTGLAGDSHANGHTYIVSPAKDGNGHICFSYSPNGKLSKADFPRGFRWFDAICALEYNGDTTAALQALNPIPRAPQVLDTRDEAERWASQHAAACDTDYVLAPAELKRRAGRAQRKRQTHHTQAAQTIADVRSRAAQDPDLTTADRAILEAMLTIAGDRGWCRPSKEQIADVSGIPLGTVKRALFSPAFGGRLECRYFTSQGKGGAPKTTAIRTFLRGSIAPTLIHESYSTCDLIPDSGAGEGGGVLGVAALAALSMVDQEACQARLLVQLADGDQVRDALDARAGGACYNPALDWTTGGVLDLSEWRDPRELRSHAVVVDDEGAAPAQLLDVATRPEPLARRKPRHKRPMGELDATDRYRLDLAGMEETQLAGELKKHQRTLKKYAGARWLDDAGGVRERLRLVQAEIDVRELPSADRRRRAAPNWGIPQMAAQLQLALEPGASGFARSLAAPPPHQLPCVGVQLTQPCSTLSGEQSRTHFVERNVTMEREPHDPATALERAIASSTITRPDGDRLRRALRDGLPQGEAIATIGALERSASPAFGQLRAVLALTDGERRLAALQLSLDQADGDRARPVAIRQQGLSLAALRRVRAEAEEEQRRLAGLSLPETGPEVADLLAARNRAQNAIAALTPQIAAAEADLKHQTTMLQRAVGVQLHLAREKEQADLKMLEIGYRNAHALSTRSIGMLKGQIHACEQGTLDLGPLQEDVP